MFNIQEFKSKMDTFGGPARSNLFVVEFSGTKSAHIDPESLRFFCKTVAVPGINLTMADYNPRNFGMSSPTPVGITNTPLNALFIMDDQHKIMSFFHEWMQSIINFDYTKDLYGTNPRYSNQRVYEFNYKTDYAVGMNIRHFSINEEGVLENSSYECALGGVYPTEISPSTLSWEGGELMTLSVNFSYDRIIFSGNSPGTGASSRNASTDYFSSVGAKSFVDTQMKKAKKVFEPFSSILT